MLQTDTMTVINALRTQLEQTGSDMIGWWWNLKEKERIEKLKVG